MKKLALVLLLMGLTIAFPLSTLAYSDSEIKNVLVEQLETSNQSVQLIATEQLDDGIYGIFFEHKFWRGFRYVKAKKIAYVDMQQAQLIDSPLNTADFEAEYRGEVEEKVNHLINYLLMVQMIIVPYILMYRMERLHPKARSFR